MKWKAYIINGYWWMGVQYGKHGRWIPVIRKGRIGSRIQF